MTLVESDTAVPPLLTLPSHLRLRIYAAVGILEGRFINLNSRMAPGYQASIIKQRFLDTYALLLTCRTIYAEVSAQVYAHNHFFIRYKDAEGLDPLQQLRPSSIHALRKFTLHLNVSSCGVNRPCDRVLDPWCAPAQDHIKAPLQLSDSGAQNAIFEWYRAWYDHIKPNLASASELELNVICDVSDEETGLMIVQPFLDQEGTTIATCSIRLSSRKDQSLQTLAEKAVMAITGSGPSSSTIDLEPSNVSLLDLPAELRQRILLYTDLVTPHNEVEWNTEHGMYCRTKAHIPPLYSLEEDHGAEEEVHRSLSSSETGRCCGTQRGCFCNTFHAVASNLQQCNCWGPPTSLFLVCQTLRQDALQVFFSQNRIVVVPSGGGHRMRAVTASPPRLPASIFLGDIVPKQALRHLRFLELVFPPFGKDSACSYCPPDSFEHSDWKDTLKETKVRLNLSQLTISAHFAPYFSHHHFPRISFRDSMDQFARQVVKESYVNTLAPLATLRGMNRFFAHLTNPAWNGFDDEKLCVKEWEDEVEQMVMGKSYDAIAAGKCTVKESRWWDDHEEWD